MKKTKLLSFGIVMILLFAVSFVKAATITSNAVTGNWGTTSSWAGSVVPSSTDDVIIVTGTVLTVDASYTCKTISITAPSTTTSITISSSNTLTVTGAVTMNGPSANTGTIAVGTGTLTAASITINGGTTASIMSVGTTGTINCSGAFSFTGTAAQAQLTVTGAGTLNVGGTFNPSAGTFACGTGTVNYNNATAQTVGYNTSSTYPYYNLTLSGGGGSSGVKTINGATFVSGTLTIAAATVLATVAQTLTLSSITLTNNFVNNGTLDMSGGAGTFQIASPNVTAAFGTLTNGTTSTVEYYVNTTPVAQTIAAANYRNLTISGARTTNSVYLASTGTIGISNTFTVSGCTFTSGTFITTGSTVNFNGTNVAQTIPVASGTAAISYNIVKINNIYGSPGVILAGVVNITTLTIGDETPGSYFCDNGQQITSTGTLNLQQLSTFRLSNNNGATTFPAFTTVNISAGTTVEYGSSTTQIVSTTPTYRNLKFSYGGTKTPAAGTLTISGDWDVGTTGSTPVALNTNNASVSLSGNLTGSGLITQGTGLITVGGDWLNTASFNNTSATGGVTLTGYAKQLSGASNLIFNTLTINGTYTNRIASSGITVNTLLAGTGTLTQGTNGAILKIGGTTSIANFDASAVTNTVDYNSSAANQTIIPTTYYNLTISGGSSRVKTLGGASTTVSNICSIAGTTILSFGTGIARTLILSTTGGYISNGGTIDMSGDNLPHLLKILSYSSTTISTLTNGTANAGIVEYNGNTTTTQYIAAASYANLVVSGPRTSGTVYLYTPINISGAFICDFATVFTSGSFTVSGIVNFNGTLPQTIPGNTKLPYSTLKINNAAGATLNGATTISTLTIGDVTSSSIFRDGGYQVTSTGTLNLNNSSTFVLGNSTATTWPAFATNTISAGTTIEYASAANQAVSITPGYYNLTFSGAGTKTPNAGTLTISNNWADGSPTALNTNNNAVNLTGTLTLTGNITQGTGTITIGGDLAGTGNLIQGTGSIILGGNWTNTGTFSASATGVNLNGSGASITGASGLTFTTLTIGPAATYTNNNPGTLTVSTALAGSGTLTQAANATLAIGGTSTISSLVAAATNNTVNYNGAAQTVFPVTYYNLTLSGSGVKTITGVTPTVNNLSISGAATATFAVPYTVTGAFNYSSSGTTIIAAGNAFSTGTFTKSGSGTLTDNAVTITVTGTGASTWTPGGFSPTGTVIFTGLAPQIGASTFRALRINRLSGTATLTGNVTVTDTLTLTLGNIVTGTNKITIASNAIGAVSRVSGQVVGNLERAITNTGSPTYTFDVGTATSYTPVSVAFTTLSTGGYLTAAVTSGQHAASGTPVDITKDVNKYWTLTNSPTSPVTCTSYAPTFTYNAGDIIGGVTPTLFIVGQYASSAWTSPTPVVNAGTFPYTTGITGLTTYGDFVVGTGNSLVVLSDNGIQVAAANVGTGTTNWVLHKSALAALSNATLTGMTCTTAGSYNNPSPYYTNILRLKVWYSANSAFSASTSTLLSTLTTTGSVGAAGAKTFPTFTPQVITGGTTGYIYITADIADTSTANHLGKTINITPGLTTTDFTFSTAGTVTGSTTAGGLQTLSAKYYNSSSGAGTLQSLSSWGTAIDGTGTNPASFTAANQIFYIYNGAAATISAPWIVGVTSGLGKVVVGDGTNACNFTIPAAYSLTFTTTGAIDVSNNATLTIANATSLTGSTGITLGALNSGSTVVYGCTGATGVVAPAANYGNLTISGGTGTTFTFGATGTTGTVAGNFSLTGGTLNMNSGSAGTLSSVAGNFSQTGGTLNMNYGSAGTLGVAGNFSQTGGTLNMASGGPGTLNVAGTFSQTGGTLNISSGSAGTLNVTGNFSSAGTINMSSGGATGTLNVTGNFSHAGGTITETGVGNGAIVFNKPGIQTYTQGTVSGTINYTINSGTTINFGTTVLGSGSDGTFTLSSGATIGIGSALGITSTGGGNIQVSGTRTYSTGANYIYNRTTGGQVTGDGLPATVKNLTVGGSGTTTSLTMSGSSLTCDTLTINSGATLTVGLLKNLTNAVRVVNNGTFTIKSDETGQGSFIDNGTTTGSGTFNIERWVSTNTGSRWEYISSPIASASSTLFTSAAHGLYYANEPTGMWISIPNGTPAAMTVMKGYTRKYVYGDGQGGDEAKTFTGAFNTGAKSIALTGTTIASVFNGWNLAGNPYPSAMDWDAAAGWTKTNVDNATYFRTNGNYASYVSGVGTNGGTKYIPSMQAFWVRVSTGQPTGTLGCTNAVRVHNTQNIYKTNTDNTLHLTVTNNTNGLNDDTYIRFMQDATDGFDGQYDAYKMFADDSIYPQVYTNNGADDISINSLGELIGERTVPLGFKTAVSGQQFTFTAGMVSSFTDNGNTVYLEDLQTGIYRDLSANSTYQFTSGVTTGLTRFVLHFNPAITSITEAANNQISIFASDNEIHINALDMLNGDVSVYDMLGQVVAARHLSGTTSDVIRLGSKSAVYIVKYTTSKQTITRRIFINQQ